MCLSLCVFDCQTAMLNRSTHSQEKAIVCIPPDNLGPVSGLVRKTLRELQPPQRDLKCMNHSLMERTGTSAST